MFKRMDMTITTDANGDATVYSPRFWGRVFTIIYSKTDFADGVDFTITLEATGEGLWTEEDVNAAKTVAPRQPTHDNAGAASLYAAAGLAVEDYIVAANDRVKIVIASGGNAKSGTFYIITG